MNSELEQPHFMNVRFLMRVALTTIGVATFAASAHGQTTDASQSTIGGHSFRIPTTANTLGGPTLSSPASEFPPRLTGSPPAPQSDEVLPEGLLFRSYAAAPHEPRMALVSLYDVDAGEWRWDGILGGRRGLFRSNTTEFLSLDAWQIDLEGAVMTRLNAQQQMDVESADYRFGLLWTGRKHNTSWKFGYFHISSHLGDEFLLTNPNYQRLNYVRESLILGKSVQLSPEWRYYGEVGWAFSVRDGAKPWQFQLGAEYAAQANTPTRGAPFAAINFQLRQEVDFRPGITGMAGWQWTGTESEHTLRTGIQYFNGPTNQYSFLGRIDHQISMGIWYDY